MALFIRPSSDIHIEFEMAFALCEKADLPEHKGTHRNSVRQRSPNNLIRENEAPWHGSCPGCRRGPISPMVQRWHQSVSQQEMLSWSPYRLRGVTGYRGLGYIMGCKGKTPWNCTRLAEGCLGEGQKVGKGRDQSDLGSYQRGKIEGIRE